MIEINQILFGKYQVLRKIGSGSCGFVYLVKHLSMDQDRALKVLPKESAFSSSALSEARLLKSLDHPLISRIYDFDEDDDFFYIAEEYISGETLDSFLLHQKFISPGLFFKYCELLCDVFIYLHSQKPSPIVYKDLKPEHIIIYRDQLKLIDFGASSYVSKPGNNSNHYGNVDFSAPESFTADDVDTKADIYSLGKLIEYILTFTSEDFSHSFKHIIQKSTNSNKDSRYETVTELLCDMTMLKSKISQPHLIKKIAVIGSHHGCGSTHIAMSLTCELNFLGNSCVYCETTNESIITKTHDTIGIFNERDGYFYYKNFCGIPNYNEGIYVPVSQDATCIYDFGTEFSYTDLSEMNLVLFVCGGGFWHIPDIYESGLSKIKTTMPIKIICNMCTKEDAADIASIFNCNVIMFPTDNDVFKHSSIKEQFISKLLKTKGGFILSKEKNFHRLLHKS